ncbi:ClbS/DfsB family four-helix bundle protein [Demequina sp.]|uniref:ClbS/DfsB family four-helix bundle protein n=1 Tax=Demequina sp. TaxID=2050685 RepID=UPI003A8A2B69
MTPSSANALIADADAQLAALLHHTDALPDHAVTAEFRGDRVADVLSHLHGWHVLFLGWVDADAAGDSPAFPSPDYGWDRLEDLNVSLLTQHAHRPYGEVRDLLVRSHSQMIEAIRELSDERLFDADARAWLGGESLGMVAHECLGNHYRWGQTVLAECAAP